MNYHIGDKIKYLRELKGLSIVDVSTHLGMKSQNSVIVIESGQKSPELDRLEKIAECLGTSVIGLITLELPKDHVRSTRASLLGQKIAKAREDLGHSLAALAEATSISEKSLKGLEKGSVKKVSDKEKISLSRSLGLPLDYLMDDDTPVSTQD